jgi:hypothetical protein
VSVLSRNVDSVKANARRVATVPVFGLADEDVADPERRTLDEVALVQRRFKVSGVRLHRSIGPACQGPTRQARA